MSSGYLPVVTLAINSLRLDDDSFRELRSKIVDPCHQESANHPGDRGKKRISDRNQQHTRPSATEGNRSTQGKFASCCRSHDSKDPNEASDKEVDDGERQSKRPRRDVFNVNLHVGFLSWIDKVTDQQVIPTSNRCYRLSGWLSQLRNEAFLTPRGVLENSGCARRNWPIRDGSAESPCRIWSS